MKSRTRSAASPRLEAASMLGLLLIAVLYLATTVINIESDPILGGDEGWIMSASAKLAEEGIFGTDLFAGFYGADEHYFFNLPLHHLILGAVFKIAGVGIEQARLVSTAFGLALLVLTWLLGRRVGGPVVALLAASLVVLLRFNLTALSGLTLTDLGATVRYDLIAVPFGMAASLLLLRGSDLPGGRAGNRAAGPAAGLSLPAAAAAGLLVGLGALTQFIGALFLAPLTAYLLSMGAVPLLRRVLLATLLVGFAGLPFVAYGGWAIAHWPDFRGQSLSIEQDSSFLSPGFYIEQVVREPRRYATGLGLEETPSSLGDLASRPSARLALLVVAPAAAVYAVMRARTSMAHRMLALLVVGLALQLMLLESTKRFVYWVVVVPVVCIAIADLGLAMWQARPPPSRLLMRGAVAFVTAVFLLEGAAVAARDIREAPSVPGYPGLAAALDAALPEGASAVGDNRLWPALREREFRSLLLLFYHTNPRISGGRATDVFGAMERIDADYILLSPLSREILSQLSERDAADFERYLRERTEPAGVLEYPGYGPIEMLRVR